MPGLHVLGFGHLLLPHLYDTAETKWSGQRRTRTEPTFSHDNCADHRPVERTYLLRAQRELHPLGLMAERGEYELFSLLKSTD